MGKATSLWRASVAVLVSGLLISSVHAVTTMDILALYGLTPAIDADAISEALYAAQQQLRSAEEVELYNEITASMTTTEIDVTIQSTLQTVASLSLEVKGGIDLPLEEILRLEAAYTTNVAMLNRLLSTKESYFVSPLDAPDVDKDALGSTIAALTETLSKARSGSELGALNLYPLLGYTPTVTSHFGTRYDPLGSGIDFHEGVDLSAPIGTPVLACFNGVVQSAGYSTTSGYYVWLSHGDEIKTFYCHLDEVLVDSGEEVTQSTVIAYSGNTGTRTTGPHLHLGLYIGGVAVDPEVVLSW